MKWLVGAGLALMLVLGGSVGGFMLLVGVASASAGPSIGGAAAANGHVATSASCAVPRGDAGGGAEGTLTSQQLANARTIIGVAKSAFPGEATQRRAAIVGIATAMQESRLRNLNYGDLNSVGMFQQRPGEEWGTVAQIMQPTYAAGKFYWKLASIPGWESMAVTVAAQTAQTSAFPDAYAQWEAIATATVASNYSTTAPIAIPADVGTILNAPSGPNDAALVNVPCNIPAGDFIVPIPAGTYTLTDGFGPRNCEGCAPFHNGQDFAAPCGTPIYAAENGIVARAHEEGSFGYVMYLTGSNGVTTLYAHQPGQAAFKAAVGDSVTAGQQIGEVGDTGLSTGCHLHFEVHVDGNPVDPLGYLLALGLPV